jgi:hypothetical protein
VVGVVHGLTGPCLGMPPLYADQTAALQLGHFAPKSALGAHVTRLLVGTEANPGPSSLRLSEAVRKAAASCHLSRAAEHEAELWAYDEKGEAAASVAD